jgi:hypothetical protein
VDLSPSNLPQETGVPGRAVFCPGCGYDLRGTSGGRCSECGLVLDRAALGRSAFPWAHRTSHGRLRAFFKTVWLVTADAALLRHEAAKAQSPRDAASFRRWVAVMVSACFAGLVVIAINAGVIAHEALDPREFGLPPPGKPRWAQDLLVPWSAGMTIAPALFAYSTILAFFVAGAPRSIFRTRGPDDYRQTVEAISGYVVAPLVLLVPATAGCAAIYFLSHREEWIRRGNLLPILIVVSFLFLLAAVAATVKRVGEWRARTAHAGYATGFGGMGELLLRWFVGAVVALVVVPWCVGFFWIVIDGFRR